MKKILLTSLIAITGLALVGCKDKTTRPTTTKDNTTTTVAPKKEVKILTPSGTPLMAIGGLIGEEGIKIDTVSGPDNIATELAKNQLDIIVAPLTAGAKLYIAGKSNFKLEAVVTTNNTYIISKKSTTLTNISDLSGKKIVAYGQNNTPDIALQNAIKTNNVTGVDITYENDVTTATSTFLGGNDYDYCLIAEPQITALKVNKGLDLNVLDLSSYMSTTIYQAGIFVNPKADQTRCNEVIEQIKNNITSLNANPSSYADIVLNKNDFFTKMGKEVLSQSIPNANISFIKASENKANIKAYYTEVNNYKAAILNGMVDDDFFR